MLVDSYIKQDFVKQVFMESCLIISNIYDAENIAKSISSKCNMNCQFCYSKENRRNSLDITIEDWKSFVDENNEKIFSKGSDSYNHGRLSGRLFRMPRCKGNPCF